jgi:hypothetical protein
MAMILPHRSVGYFCRDRQAIRKQRFDEIGRSGWGGAITMPRRRFFIQGGRPVPLRVIVFPATGSRAMLPPSDIGKTGGTHR